jgi:hypothetical protein
MGLGNHGWGGNSCSRISEALHTHSAFRSGVTFNTREAAPLIEAARAHPRTWALLLEDADFSAVSPAQRKRLLETSEELLETLQLDRDQYEARALIADIGRLRDTLRAA